MVDPLIYFSFQPVMCYPLFGIVDIKKNLTANRKGIFGYQSHFCVFFGRGNNLESADAIRRKVCLASDKYAAQIMHEKEERVFLKYPR